MGYFPHVHVLKGHPFDGLREAFSLPRFARDINQPLAKISVLLLVIHPVMILCDRGAGQRL